MFGTVLRLFGVDLEYKLLELKSHLNEVIDHGTHRLQQRVTQGLTESGTTLIFALLGGLAALATVGLGVAALFIWVQRSNGTLVALAVVACAMAGVAGLMFTIAAIRGERSKSSTSAEPAKPPPVVVTRAPRPAPARPLDLSSMMPPPPANASIVDILAHRVVHRAAQASDEVIDSTAEVLRGGSRGAVVATLTVVGLLGILIGRRTMHG